MKKKILLFYFSKIGEVFMIDQIIHGVKNDFCNPVSSFAANKFKQFVKSEVSKDPSYASI